MLSAGLLAALLTLVPDPVAVLSADGAYVMVSPGFTRTFGWQPAEVAGRRFTLFLDDADRADAQVRHEAAHEAGAEYERRGRHRCADGSTLPIHVRSRTVRAGGRLYRVALIHPEPPPPPRRVIAARLRLVGMERVREQLGARWDAVAERAVATAETVLRRGLDRQDRMSRCDGDFLVCFAGLSAAEAASHATALAEEITRHLAGEVAESAARAVSFAAEIAVPSEIEAPEALSQAIRARLLAEQAGALADAWALLQRSAASAVLRPETVLHATGRTSSYVLAGMDDGLDGRLLHLAGLGWTGQEPDLPAEVLLLRLGLACAWMATQDAGATIIIPAPWSSLSQRRVLERAARLLWEVPRPMRERIGFEVRAVPANVSRSRLGELVTALTALGRPPSIELSAPAAACVLEGIVQRLDLVTMHVDSLLLPGTARAEALVRELAAWRARLLVREVDHDEQFTLLYAMGVPLLAGRALDGGDPGGDPG
jgi:PAS domain S-box-containing protein